MNKTKITFLTILACITILFTACSNEPKTVIYKANLGIYSNIPEVVNMEVKFYPAEHTFDITFDSEKLSGKYKGSVTKDGYIEFILDGSETTGSIKNQILTLNTDGWLFEMIRVD